MKQGPNSDAVLQNAVTHHRAGRLKEAEAVYRDIVAQHPGHPDATHLLGLMAHQKGDPEEAVALIGQAIEANPGNPAYYSNLGNALRSLGRAGEAEAAYRRALDMAPDLLEVHSNLGNTLREQGRFDEAVESYGHALALNPDVAEPLGNLGAVLYGLGRIDEALEFLKRSLEINPEFVESLCNLGHVHKELGMPEEAAKSYHQALEMREDFAEAHTGLGNLFQEQGHMAEAVACFEKARAAAPDDQQKERDLRRAMSRMVPSWHLPMLADETRNEAYCKAIEKAVVPGMRVLDIGTGSGLLAMMAARAGAEHVTACEVSAPLAEAARCIVADNGLADAITVINKKSTKLEIGVDMEAPVDLVISEILDAGLIGEGMLPTMRHALGLLVTKDSVVIPRSATLHGMLVSIPGRTAVNPITEVCGFDLSAFNRFRSPLDYQSLNLAHEEHRPMSEVFEGVTFDFRDPPSTASSSDPHMAPLQITATADGAVDAVAFWFDLALDDEITVSSRPGGELVHWGQAVQFFDDTLMVKKGGTVDLMLVHSDTEICFMLP